MIITTLRKKGNDVIIVFDDGSFLNLDYRIVIDYGLRKGDHPDEEKIEMMKDDNSFLKIRDSALRLLSRRLHSSSEIRTKLLRKKYPEEIIAKVVTNLKEKKYLDDEVFAKAFIAERIKGKRIGTNRLAMELMKRGINKSISQKYINEIDSEIYSENAITIAKKKLSLLKKKESDSRKISSKLFMYLMSKGYESDLIRKILNELRLEILE